MSHAQDRNAAEIQIRYSGKAAKSYRNEEIGSKQKRKTLLATDITPQSLLLGLYMTQLTVI